MTDVIDKSAVKRLRIQLADNPAALNLLTHIEALRDERNLYQHGHRIATDNCVRLEAMVAHWQGNHNNMVARCAMLSQRDDLPVDRIPAYRELARLQNEIERLQREIKVMHSAAEVKVEVRRDRVWIVKGVQSFMLAYEADTNEERQWYATQLRNVLASKATNG